MATRQDIISGLEMTIAEARRTTSLFQQNEWDTKRPGGWTPKEIYTHLGSLAAMVSPSVHTFLQASEDEVLFQDIDIDQLNAGAVAAGISKTPQQVMQEFETNYRKLMDLVNSLSDDQLSVRRRFVTPRLRLGSDIVATEFVLHGLHHVYEAATS